MKIKTLWNVAPAAEQHFENIASVWGNMCNIGVSTQQARKNSKTSITEPHAAVVGTLQKRITV